MKYLVQIGIILAFVFSFGIAGAEDYSSTQLIAKTSKKKSKKKKMTKKQRRVASLKESEAEFTKKEYDQNKVVGTSTPNVPNILTHAEQAKKANIDTDREVPSAKAGLNNKTKGSGEGGSNQPDEPSRTSGQ